MTAQTLEEEAADKIEELWDKLGASYEELERIYEIAAVLYEVARGYLDQVNMENLKPEELEAVNTVRDAVQALSSNVTIAQATLVREEETDE